MGKLVKCPLCNEYVDKDTTKKIKKRYYCIDKGCYDKQMESVESDQPRKELLDFISKLANDSKVAEFGAPQYIKKLINDGFTYSGIKGTLEYYYIVLGNPVPEIKSRILAIVPYNYNEARNYYREKRDTDTFNRTVVNSGTDLIKRCVVHVHVTEDRKQSKQIDFENLE